MMANSRKPSFASCTCFYQSRVAFFTPKEENSKRATFHCWLKKTKTSDWVPLNDLELTWNVPFLVVFQRLFTRGKCGTNQNSNEKNTWEKWGHRSKWPLQKTVISPRSAPGRPQLPSGVGGGMCAFNPPRLMSCWFGPSEPISQRGSRVRGARSHVEGLIKQYGPQRPFHIRVLPPHP